jgi:hypothetical protein
MPLSAAQQEKNNSADLHRSRVNITGFISPTHTRTEGGVPVRCSEFTTKAAKQQGLQQNSCPAFLYWALAQLLPAPAFRFTRLSGRKSPLSGDFGLQRRSRRARSP